MPFYESQPIVYPLYRLLEEVLAGDIRVPRFQRPGTEATWSPEQRGQLLDSIYRGFPIGTILLWSTTEDVKTLNVVGAAKIPVPKNLQRRRLILDGHQRISTLIAALGPALEGFSESIEADEAAHERWVFNVDESQDSDASAERFELLRSDEIPSDKQVPVEIALDRVKLNEWVRKQEKLSRGEIRIVDSLRDRLREYNIPIATLAAESLEIATETFKRINSSGTPMSAFHMVSALAYSDTFDPQEHFERVREEYLDPEGWGSIDDADILRICAGLIRRKNHDASQHPAKLDIDRLGKSLREYPKLIDDAGTSIVRAARLLKRVVGVHGPGILPYSWQMIILAIELGTRPTGRLSRDQAGEAARWFWVSTYGGVFGGVNSAIVDRATRALSDMLEDGDERAMLLDVGRRVEEPGRFDFRAARARACLLAMARMQDQGDFLGAAHKALAAGSGAVYTISPKNGRSKWYNLVIDTESAPIKSIRDALRGHSELEQSTHDAALLSSVGIDDAIALPIDKVLQARRAKLRSAEREFALEYKFNWPQAVSRKPRA